MMGVRSAAVGLALLMAALPSHAWPDDPFANCRSEFFGGQAPQVAGSGVGYALCAQHFATLYSPATKTPLFSAERLTYRQIVAAIRMSRPDEFHADARLPAGIGAEPADFWHSGFDAGHMAPNGDMPDADAQFESFALSNVVPQDPDDNRGLWADIEYAVRDLALRRRDTVYVVTGPIFAPDAARIHGGVSVPALLFKAVYDPFAGIGAVYVAPNTSGYRYERLSLGAFARKYGSIPFPALSGTMAEGVRAELPVPVPHNHDAMGRSSISTSHLVSIWRRIGRSP